MNFSIKNQLFTGIIASVFCITACTDHMGDAEINLFSGSATSVADVATAEGMLYDVMYKIHDSREHQYQYQTNLHIDNYAGYFCVANSLQGRLPSTYFMNPNFEAGPTDNMLWVARATVPVMNSADTLHIPELGAIASIIFNFTASEYVDLHGPMPYFAYRSLQEDPPVAYDKVSVVYKTIIEELKKAQQTLKDIAPLTIEQEARLKRIDRIAKGGASNWIKFANTLRLRLAMRMVKIEPELAKAEAESAYQDGILEDGDVNIELDLGGGRHPLYVISIQWYDTRLNASLETLLKRYAHPFLEHWFSPLIPPLKNIDGTVVVPGDRNDIYAGIRSGTSVHQKEERMDTYIKYSTVNGNLFGSKNVDIMKVSESFFLCSEAQLRGWNVGSETAMQYYYKGITRHFEDEGKSEMDAKEYYKLEAPLNVTYHDWYDPENDYADNLVQVGIRWDRPAGLTNEQHLEQIITQKYIAIFPLGMEAWSEHRRTGYPRLIPVVYDAGDNSIPTGGHIRRVPYHVSSSNIDDISGSALPALKAEDSSGYADDVQGARLWWDVKNKGNF